MPSVQRDSLAGTNQHAGHLLESAAQLKNKAKSKVKDILTTPNSQVDGHGSIDNEDDIFADAAFDPARVIDTTSPESKKSARDTISDGIKDAKYLATHPRRVMRSQATRKAAATIGNAQHSPLTTDRDRELLEAHHALDNAISRTTSIQEEEDCEEAMDEVEDAHDRIQKVEDQRESLQTAWILRRHVSRVRVVRPIPRPEKSQFTTESRFEWERYVGHLALYYTRGFTAPYIDDFDSPPFDLEDLARIVERIAITSAPWQAFLLSIREVYMWKDPKRTGRWLALFLVLWYTQHIMAFFYFYIIYSTVRNKFRPSSVQTVRDNVTRAIDRKARVQAWGDLIQRHGKDDWLEPLLNEVGPIIQMQLGDVADLLEVMVNFHRHEKPRLTIASVFLFSCCLAVSLFADMAFCVKLVWFIIGAGFFVTYPIATNFPKYRLVVSHFRWMFWDIPTHAELAILRLQEKAVVRDADLSEFEWQKDEDERANHSDSGEDEELPHWSDSHSFNVFDKADGRGRLFVGRAGLALHTKTMKRSWPFVELHEMRKLDGMESNRTLKNLKKLHSRSSSAMQIIFLHDELEILLHPADRDRVFNLILAWSAHKWQSLQMERQNSDRGNLDRAIKRIFH
jgi:hypothetical protein